MDVRSTPRKRGRTDGDVSPVKRRQKTNMFLEYQPRGLNAHPSKNSVPVKQKTSASSRRLSCEECRRLKLKCDRVFPCKACIRRGCQGICPNGSLVSGKGTRYVLASTEQLHEKISRMSDRIRELEEALQALYEEHYACQFPSRKRGLDGDADVRLSVPVHPLLQGEKLRVKDHLELYDRTRTLEASIPDAMGHLHRRDDHVDQLEARTPSEESTRCTGSSSTLTPRNFADSDQHREQQQADRPSVIRELSTSFWHVWENVVSGGYESAKTAYAQSDGMMIKLARVEILDELPTREEAERLCNIAQETGFFVTNYVLTHSEISGIADDIYCKENADVSILNVALLAVLLCIGLHVGYTSSDTESSRERTNEQVEDLFSTSRAAMTLHALMTGLESSGEQTLRVLKYHVLLLQVLALFSSHHQQREQTKKSMNIVVGLVEKAELHTESSCTQYKDAKQIERRFLFYEILSLVGDICLALDQPVPFCWDNICKPPTSEETSGMFETQLEAAYYEAKHRFYVDCMKPTTDIRSVAPSSLQYTDILELDHKIRTFRFPLEFLQGYNAKPVDAASLVPSLHRLKLQRFITIYRINSVLLHLHRKFMQQCLSSRNSVLAHPYFASVVATSRSAWVLICNSDSMHREYPDLVNGLALPWYNAFSAAAALFVVLERIPYCPVAPYSLRQLLTGANLFDRASTWESPVAARASPIVRQFAVRGVEVVRRWKDILVSELSADPILQARKDYCLARFDAIVRRINQGNHSSVPFPVSTSVSGRQDDAIEMGLEIWDVVHPEIGEVLTRFPGCVIDEDTSEEHLLETVYSPSNLEAGHQRCGERGVRSPLVEFFDALDQQLRRRPDFIMSAVQNERQPGSEATGGDDDILRALFPGDLDLDWAALTDALVSVPAELNSVLSGDWNTQQEFLDAGML